MVKKIRNFRVEIIPLPINGYVPAGPSLLIGEISEPEYNYTESEMHPKLREMGYLEKGRFPGGAVWKKTRGKIYLIDDEDKKISGLYNDLYPLDTNYDIYKGITDKYEFLIAGDGTEIMSSEEPIEKTGKNYQTKRGCLKYDIIFGELKENIGEVRSKLNKTYHHLDRFDWQIMIKHTLEDYKHFNFHEIGQYPNGVKWGSAGACRYLFKETEIGDILLTEGYHSIKQDGDRCFKTKVGSTRGTIILDEVMNISDINEIKFNSEPPEGYYVDKKGILRKR